MPSKIFIEDDDSEIISNPSEIQPKVGKKSPISAEQKFDKNISEIVEKDNIDSGVAPFLIPDIEDPFLDSSNVLIQDGHLIPKPPQVVRSNSKVATEQTRNSFQVIANSGEIGKKPQKHEFSKVATLRSELGISWKRIGQRMALLSGGLSLIILVLFSIIGTWLLGIWNNTPELSAKPFESSVVYARDGTTELFKYFKEERREIVEICTESEEANLESSPNCIPKNMQLAVLALEDENFYYNDDGIPWQNIAGSALKCLTSAGDECRGGSGLSQQLVKNVTKQDDATISRKISELLTAIKLNQNVNKTDVLYLYLNQVPFGRNAYGVQEASKSYYDKDIKNISIPESCYLAALIQKPSAYEASISQPESTDYVDFNTRKDICLSKLRTLSIEGDGKPTLIETDEKLEELRTAKVEFKANKNELPYPHFRDFVTQELRKFRLSEQALATQGYKIVTTLDPVIQEKTERSIRESEQSAIFGNGANNAAAIVLDGPTGEIVAMVGSRDYNDTSIDGQVNIITSPQQPGSSIKPYVYAAAFNKDFNPGTILGDVGTNFESGFRPKNYSGRFNGALSIRTSLQNSYNIPAVKAAYLAAGEGNLPDGTKGINEVFSFSEATGLRYPCINGAFNSNPAFVNSVETCTPSETLTQSTINSAYKSRCGVSASIGGCEVTMLSHATGMNTFAQDGNLRTATPFISIVSTQTGKDIYQEVQNSPNPVYPRKDAAINPLIAKQLNNVLSDYGSRYREFGQLARNLELDGWDGDNRVAAKTGTTDEVRDTWTVGYTPYYTTVVWVGNTDNSPMRNTASSSSAPAPIWKKIMTEIHQGKDKKGFSKEGLIPTRLSTRSGLLDESSGYIELLTPTQVEVLKQAANRLSRPEYNPRNESIFNNRSAIVTRKLRINNFDKQIAVDGKTLPENISEIICSESISEFPLNPNWIDPMLFLQGQDQCPVVQSTQDQVLEQSNKPIVSTNISGNSFSNAISVSASTTGNVSKSIASIEVLIDGATVASNTNAPSLNYPIDANFVGANRNIVIRVRDSFGILTEVVYSGVTIVLAPIANSDFSGIGVTCQPAIANSVTNCSFNMPAGRGFSPSIKLAIGNSVLAGNCTINNTLVTCVSVPTGSATGNPPVFGTVTGPRVQTPSTVLIN
jgi:membrane peptidoglycan carboxypeptidase/archaellum component FlaF (FlaF/FlaG flagellin family)